MKNLVSIIIKFKFFLRVIKGKYNLLVNIIRNLRFYFYKKTSSYKNIDIYNIPIIIISFNQLFYLKNLIDSLKQYGYKNIVIIDNASTYKPLLDYFETIRNQITLILLNENHGHQVFWKLNEINKKYVQNYYVVTDPDINPMEDCPKDFLKYFKTILDKNFKINKVGFSLYLDDIPDTNPDKNKIVLWESKFWQNKNEEGNYIASIDTTFALYKPKRFSKISIFYKAIRTQKPYTARHGGWYVDPENLTNEQEFYINTSNASSSWLSKESVAYNKV